LGDGRAFSPQENRLTKIPESSSVLEQVEEKNQGSAKTAGEHRTVISIVIVFRFEQISFVVSLC